MPPGRELVVDHGRSVSEVPGEIVELRWDLIGALPIQIYRSSFPSESCNW